jgi:hypothetical protein
MKPGSQYYQRAYVPQQAVRYNNNNIKYGYEEPTKPRN